MTTRVRKVRIDALLVDRGLASTRAEAHALVMAGAVFHGETRLDKPGHAIAGDAVLTVASRKRFVSRGGDKLEGALEDFAPHGLVVAGRTCLDVGASTGGFTDCLIQRGAAHVVAVDVGFGLLAESLRKDPRVEVRERVNARHLTAADFATPPELVVVDASFISLAKLADALAAVLTAKGGELVALVKPQFEAGREAASKGKGVIRDEEVRAEAIAQAAAALVDAGFVVIASADCRVHGPKGNVEHFVYARLSARDTAAAR